jgi:hypothetical protein
MKLLTSHSCYGSSSALAGTVASVQGTIYDFRKPTPFRKNYAQANGGPHKGFDLNYVLIKPLGPNANPQAKYG